MCALTRECGLVFSDSRFRVDVGRKRVGVKRSPSVAPIRVP